MRQTVKEGLNLAQQLAALPLKAASELFRESDMARRPLGNVVQESLQLSQNLVQLPFKATAALLDEMADRRPNLADRVTDLERRMAGSPADPNSPLGDPAAPEA